jgi:UDP-glucose 4-epimerase
MDRLVADGHGVTVLDNLSTGKRENLHFGATLVEGDVADATLVQSLVAKVNGVIHLAAVASVERCETDIEASHRTNFIGTKTVLEAAATARVPVIYASSAAVYGDNPSLPLSEASATQPINRYGADKLAGEVEAARLGREQGLASVGLRFFNVYGPQQDPTSPYSGVISKFMAAASKGKPLTFFGDGEQTRDFIYVGDVVALIVSALKHTSPGALLFNGCTGRATSLKQLAATIGTALGKPITITHAPARIGDIRHSLGDATEATKTLGFRATTDLAAGLAALVGTNA